MASEEEDDYLTMALPDPTATKPHKHETLTERKKRLAREAEARAHPKSKSELAAEAKQKREAGLQKNLLAANGSGADEPVKSKGAAMMAKLGYVPGTALGAVQTSSDGSKDTRPLETVQTRPKRRRLQDVNVLWRGLVKQREVSERDRRMRYDLHQSLSMRADYNDPEEDREDRIALGKKETEEVDGELDWDDEELAEFEGLEVVERLDRLVKYLRERWRYCFWCKYRYPDEEMEGCPGTKEEDHD